MNTQNKFMKVIRKQPVDIEFSNISFIVGEKQILHSVSGKFLPGQLIGIVGASGAGKTSLLNILSGQLLAGVSGDVFVNSEPREMRKFRKMSAYLMQDDLLQPFLTVEESVSIASHLKLGNHYSCEEKIAVVKDVLSVMDLENCVNTNVEKLSGGERKQLSLALELINNPPVIFLDEPTTGLDNVAMKNCVDMLKSLTNQGRTIICTIHQPSDSAFKLFDIVYFLSDGYCIYNGTVDRIIPHLYNLGFDCPISYSPSDYILEILNPTNTNVLSEEIRNGKSIVATNKLQTFQHQNHINEDIGDLDEFPVNPFVQFKTLLSRKFIQVKRNKAMLSLEIFHTLLCGLFLGILFYNIGDSGTKSYDNIKLYLATMIYLMYTHMLSSVLLFPGEVKLLYREYFNRWYCLKAYFAVLTVSVIPIVILTSLLFVIIVYPITGQPMEFDRFCWFLLINIAMSLIADGLGYAIGSTLNPVHGAVVGLLFLGSIVLLGTYNVGYADESSDATRNILMVVSFLYDGWVALTTSMLNNRKAFICEDIYCYFGDPQFLLKKMGMEDRTQHLSILILLAYFVVFKFITYVSLRLRLS